MGFLDSLVGKESTCDAVFLGFPCGSAGEESTCNVGDLGLTPGLERSPGERKGYPLQCSGLENFLDHIVHGVTESDMTEWLSLSNKNNYQNLKETQTLTGWMLEDRSDQWAKHPSLKTLGSDRKTTPRKHKKGKKWGRKLRKEKREHGSPAEDQQGGGAAVSSASCQRRTRAASSVGKTHRE